jgi:hypothetical protein
MHALSPNLYLAMWRTGAPIIICYPLPEAPHRQAEPLVELRLELLLSREVRSVFDAFEEQQDGLSAGWKC